MNGRILHESAGRLRVHLQQVHMTMDQADLLEAYLRAQEEVLSAKVYERTADAVIHYDSSLKQEGRARVLRAISSFSYQKAAQQIRVPEHSGRALQNDYLNRMTWEILSHYGKKLFLPVPWRSAVTVVKAVPYILEGLKVLAKGRLEVPVLDAASIVVSMARGDFGTAASVMFLLKIGEIMEEWTHRKSVDDLAGEMALHADQVWVRTQDGSEVLTDIKNVKTGDLVIVRTGHMIPLDGEVRDGDAMVNQASITGEPLAVHKKAGGYVYAGTAVEEGELVIAAAKESGSGRYDRIVAMIEESEKLKSDAENRASRLADRLVPWSLGTTVLTYLITRDAVKATSILMVDFCCALKLSMPIAVLSAMREARANSISVKGGKFMEAYAQADTMIFDKTGTLTAAQPIVTGVTAFAGRDPKEMLRLAACLEEHYPHSLANAVVQAAKERGLDHEERHAKVEYVVAHGIVSSVDGNIVRIGSYHFIFEDEGCHIPEGEEERFEQLPDSCTRLYLAEGDTLSAVILIEDPIREEAAQVIRGLHEMGVNRIVMMTGDGEHTARAIAAAAGMDEYHSGVLPEDKAVFVRNEHQRGHKVIMIGDGVNDSPALSEADVGAAISSGSAIAREIADITISEDNLYALIIMRRLSCALMDRIHRNYHFIIGFNSMLIVMGMFGLLTPAASALLHNASTIAISLHSMTDLLDE